MNTGGKRQRKELSDRKVESLDPAFGQNTRLLYFARAHALSQRLQGVNSRNSAPIVDEFSCWLQSDVSASG